MLDEYWTKFVFIFVAHLLYMPTKHNFRLFTIYSWNGILFTLYLTLFSNLIQFFYFIVFAWNFFLFFFFVYFFDLHTIQLKTIFYYFLYFISSNFFINSEIYYHFYFYCIAFTTYKTCPFSGIYYTLLCRLRYSFLYLLVCFLTSQRFLDKTFPFLVFQR